ncbi:plant UBX domain-containing protein 4-like [Silene latifolia]|uniref:plant UBX domain-containing protein 4-like n=1 Tax=Silene latifolia TaxID=37657 RepID=UPI003D774F20
MASDQQHHEQPNPNPIPDPMVNTFMEITSSTPEEAQFYLESHNFDLDAAVSTFFESNTAETAAIPNVEVDDTAAEVSRSPSPSPSRSRSHSPPAAAGRSQYNLRTRTTRSGVRTLADLNNDGSGSDGDDDGDRPPQYFTGGHKSGMVVEDPSKGNNVDAIFEHARRVGAMEGPADVYQPPSSSRSFAGTARLLSGETVSASPHEPPPEVVNHTITFWRNGFTVNDGPLRLLDDEANASFLESIKNSECPKELEPKDRRTKVSVNLTRRDENCPVQEPQRRQIAFQGVGRTLGSTTSAPAESTVLNTAPAPVMGLVVDDKLPSTSIQLRLADGTRMVSRFNHHHTIRDIRGFIDASRPTRGGAYTLQLMGFPPKPLTELDQTIEQAGLSNSVVIQKY